MDVGEWNGPDTASGSVNRGLRFQRVVAANGRIRGVKVGVTGFMMGVFCCWCGCGCARCANNRLFVLLFEVVLHCCECLREMFGEVCGLYRVPLC